MTENKNEKPHPVARIQERIGAAFRVTADVLPEDSGYRGTVVVLSAAAAERVADMLDLLSRLRGEALEAVELGADTVRALHDANERDLERQRGGRVWTVRLIVRRDAPAPRPGPASPTFDELVASRAIRMLSPSAGNADSADVVELAPPADVAPKDSHQWATLAATTLHDLGFDAVPAPAWGRS